MGTLKLPPSGRIYLDANIVIYAVEKIPAHRSILEPLWLKVKSGRLSLVTSELTLLEVLTHPFRFKDTILELSFREYLSANEMTLMPLQKSILEAAAHYRNLGLKIPDAIHAATGTACGCSLFLTNDAVFERVPGLPLAILHKVAAA